MAPEVSEPLAAAASRRQLVRRAGVVSAAVAASRVVGVLREQAFAVFFGAGRELDAFVTAFRIPNLLRDLFAEGALSAAFVSTFTQCRERDGEAAAWRLANRVLNLLAVIVGALCLLGIACAPGLVRLIAPGFAAIPGKLALTTTLTRIMFPFLLLVAVAAVAMGVLNTCGVFGIPAATGAFFNLGSLAAGLACAWWIAPGYIGGVVRALEAGAPPPTDPALAARAILGMAVGTLVGGALQVLVQLPALGRVGFRYAPLFSPRDPAVRQVLRLMAPAAIGAAAVQVNVVVNNNFASYLGDGPVSWLNIAFRFMQLPIGLFGVAVGTVTLPAVARHVALGDGTALRATLREALEMVALCCLPAAAGLALFGAPLIAVVYQHGRFGPADTHAAAMALAGYALGLVGYAGVKVLAPAFYALDDARTPMLVSLASMGTNYALNWSFVRALGLGHVGLALSTSAVALANCVVLYALLRRRLGPLGRGLPAVVLRIGGATAVMALVAGAIDRALAAALLPPTPLRALVRLAVGGPVGATTFWVAGRALAVPLPRWPWREDPPRPAARPALRA